MQARLDRMAGFFCCRKVKEGEDGGVPYVRYLQPPLPGGTGGTSGGGSDSGGDGG